MRSVLEEQRTICLKLVKNAMLFMQDVQLLVPLMLIMCVGEVIRAIMLLPIELLARRYVGMANEGPTMPVMMAIFSQEMAVRTTVLWR